ncbi:MAG TPA: sulfotransferase [Gaiella sp.]|jgi:hypothetical protein
MRARGIGAAVLYGRSAARIARRRRRLGSEERLVFVVGSPRSGTTVTASLIGSLPGFVDLDEVQPWKASIPRLVDRPVDEGSRRLRTILERVRRLGLASGLRGVEQTPETSFVLAAALQAYPQAVAIHVIRDGRDVATSLLERGWLSAGRTGADDARLAYGSQARFWVEPERREEFGLASNATRAAWAWRRYTTAAQAVPERTVEVRYEQLVSAPSEAALAVAEALGVAPDLLAERFSGVHDRSAGRWRRDLTAEQLTDVEREAGATLASLGYAPS